MSRSRLAAAAILLTVAVGSTAAAEVAYVNIDIGGLVGVPTQGHTPQLGGAVSVEVGAILINRIQIGGRSRFALTTEHIGGGKKGDPPAPTYTGPEVAQSASVVLAYLPLVRPRIRLGLGVSAGFGFWTGCVGGDFCGGYGALVGGDLRAYMPIGPRANVHVTLELLAQFGIHDSHGPFYLPTLWLGVGF